MRETQIPFSARIMAVCDVYDALTSKRRYKAAFSHAESCRMIREGRGTQFDPAVVDALDAVADEFHAIRQRFQEDPPPSLTGAPLAPDTLSGASPAIYGGAVNPSI